MLIYHLDPVFFPSPSSLPQAAVYPTVLMFLSFSVMFFARVLDTGKDVCYVNIRLVAY